MKQIKIGKKIIGDGYPTYIIAEIGINHNGDVSLAKEMVLAAWESGADAVKIQTFVTKDFLHPKHPSYNYDINAEISHAKEQEIWDFAKNKNINLFSTPEEFKSLKFIKKQKPKLIKIAAMDFNYKELVQKAALSGKPIILSSGMSTMKEVKNTIRWVKEVGNDRYIVLHCVSCYPTKPSACNLNAIKTMKQALDCPVGFSDHSIGIHIPLAAIVLGANVIEKHFTIEKKLPGPDQKCSMNPKELRELVQCARDIESSLGNGRKEPSDEEKAPRLYKRRGIYSSKNLKKGTILKRKHVIFLAPSNEKSSVSFWELFEGKQLIHDISRNMLIGKNDLK
ncbi:MAG: hypothetical protein ACD_79C00287G0029 [uncultured bacterium]|nr:MAG: hypothetical protein ACD_79C00287G0029 [uncultured bacterium]